MYASIRVTASPRVPQLSRLILVVEGKPFPEAAAEDCIAQRNSIMKLQWQWYWRRFLQKMRSTCRKSMPLHPVYTGATCAITREHPGHALRGL